MKKILLTVFSMAICFYSINTAQSFVRYEEKNLKNVTMLKMAGYNDYAPFGWFVKDDNHGFGGAYSVFKPIIDVFEADKEANVKVRREIYGDNEQLIQKVRSGKVDFFVGAYNETEVFKGLHLLYPAVIYNPITVFMLPNRINEVTSTEDLKKLKGIRNRNEIFSDFVERKLGEYNLSEADSSYQAFEKLFKREADYIISSYYNGMIEAIKLGIKKQIAPAKQTLWRIPMFVGVSKTSQHREMISRRITKYLNDKNNVKSVEQYLQSLIREFEQKYEGVVPPTFIEDSIASDLQTSQSAD